MRICQKPASISFVSSACELFSSALIRLNTIEIIQQHTGIRCLFQSQNGFFQKRLFKSPWMTLPIAKLSPPGRVETATADPQRHQGGTVRTATLAMVVAAIMVVIMVEWLGVMATGLEWPGRASLFDGFSQWAGELVRWWWDIPVCPRPRNATLPGSKVLLKVKPHQGFKGWKKPHWGRSPSYSPQKATSNIWLLFFCRKNASKWDHMIITQMQFMKTNPTQRKDTHHPSLALSCYKATSPSLGCWWRLEQLEPTK